MILAGARRLRDPRLVDVHVSGGRVRSVVPAGSIAAEPAAGAGSDVVDVGGRVVLPGFVESHLHLDKAWLGCPPGGAGLAEAIRWTATRKARFTVDDVAARAELVARLAVGHGTTTIRAHTEVDPDVGLVGVEGVRAVAERLGGTVRIQLAVFPQEGLLCRPGTLELVREALQLPDVVVGGCPYVEKTREDAERHVDAVLDLAVEHGVPADLHLDLADDTDDPRFTLAEYVARRVIDRGLEGRVTLGHATTLAAATPSERSRALELLARADVTVTVLPATDLYLSGRNDARNVRRGVAPLRELWRSGVRVAVSSNNVRNAFTPTGRADPLDIALLAARVGHVSEQDELDLLVDAVTTVGARVVDGPGPHGVEPGARADLVVLDTTDADALLLDQPRRHLVLCAGVPVAGASCVAGVAGVTESGRAVA